MWQSSKQLGLWKSETQAQLRPEIVLSSPCIFPSWLTHLWVWAYIHRSQRFARWLSHWTELNWTRAQLPYCLYICSAVLRCSVVSNMCVHVYIPLCVCVCKLKYIYWSAALMETRLIQIKRDLRAMNHSNVLIWVGFEQDIKKYFKTIEEI